MVTAPGFFLMLLAMPGSSCHLLPEMVGIDDPADERLYVYPAGSHIIHVILFLCHNVMEAMSQIVLNSLEDKPNRFFGIPGLNRFLCSRYNRTFA